MAHDLRASSAPAVTPVQRRRHEDAEETGKRGWVGPAVAVALAMGAGAIATLVLTGMQSNAIYSKPVDQLLAERVKFLGRPVRAEGTLVHGSLEKRDQPCEYRFTIAKNGAELPVRFAQCVVPDTFRDVPGMDVGVTVEGELRSGDQFERRAVDPTAAAAGRRQQFCQGL